jgi:transcriptional/translational regulatory protein YebC/TACO1
VRAAFTKAGGSLGETNSVSFMFDRLGQVTYPASVASADAMFEAALDAGAENVESGEEEHVVTGAPDDLNAVRDALEKRFGEAASAKLVWRPKTTAPIDGETAASLFKLLETLEDSDDVQNVYANFEVSDETMASLA